MALVTNKAKCPIGLYDTVAKVCVQSDFNEPVDFEMEEVAVMPTVVPVQPITKGFALSSLAVLGVGALVLWYVTKELSK